MQSSMNAWQDQQLGSRSGVLDDTDPGNQQTGDSRLDWSRLVSVNHTQDERQVYREMVPRTGTQKVQES